MNSFKKNFQFSFLLLVLFFSIFSYCHRVNAYGLTPPIIEINNMLRDSVQEKTVTVLLEKEREKNTYFSVVPRGQYAHYINAPKQLIIPAGKLNASFTFKIITANTAIGDYDILLDFFESQEDIEKSVNKNENSIQSGVAIRQGVTLTIRMIVTGEQVIGYQFKNLQARDSEVDMPLFLSFFILNSGNVDWRPEKMAINLINNLDSFKNNALSIKGESIPLVGPGENKEIKIQLDHNLTEGKYLSKAYFYDKDEVVGELSSQQFRIYAPGTLKQVGEFLNLETNKTAYDKGEKIKLIATFRNIGEVPVKGILVTEVYRDNGLQDVRRSKEAEIDREEEVEFNDFFELFESGNYTLSSYVEYGNKKTKTKKVEIKINGKGLTMLQAEIILSIFILLIFIILIVYKKYLKRKE